MNALDVQHLTVTYHETIVLRDVSCHVPQGVLCAIIGPNGAGKSTLLKTIVDLVGPLAGKVRILGRQFADVRSHVAYVPQRMSVDWDFPVTVFDVALMGRYYALGWFWRPGFIDKKKAEDALELVGMRGYQNTPIAHLSGGQQQRVFLARALAQEAQVYILDEPFAGVDQATEHMMLDLFARMRQEGKTIIIVHHNLDAIPGVFDWVIVLNKGVVTFGSQATVFAHEEIVRLYNRSRYVG